MRDTEVAAAQAASLVGLALTDRTDAYTVQLQNLVNPLLVINSLVKMVSKSVQPADWEAFGTKLLSTVHAQLQ